MRLGQDLEPGNTVVAAVSRTVDILGARPYRRVMGRFARDIVPAAPQRQQGESSVYCSWDSGQIEAGYDINIEIDEEYDEHDRNQNEQHVQNIALCCYLFWLYFLCAGKQTDTARAL